MAQVDSRTTIAESELKHSNSFVSDVEKEGHRRGATSQAPHLETIADVVSPAAGLLRDYVPLRGRRR